MHRRERTGDHTATASEFSPRHTLGIAIAHEPRPTMPRSSRKGAIAAHVTGRRPLARRTDTPMPDRDTSGAEVVARGARWARPRSSARRPRHIGAGRARHASEPYRVVVVHGWSWTRSTRCPRASTRPTPELAARFNDAARRLLNFPHLSPDRCSSWHVVVAEAAIRDGWGPAVSWLRHSEGLRPRRWLRPSRPPV